MAEQSYPFENQSTSESQYSSLFRLLADTGVVGSSTSGDLRPYGDSSGMFVRVPTGQALVRGFLYVNDSLLTLQVAAAAGSQRVDSVVLRLDPAANVVSAVLRQGSPGGGPPALTQTDSGVYEVRLGDVTVPGGSTTVAAGQVADRRSFTSQPWGEWTNDTRPPAPTRGKAGYNQSTGVPEFWTGTGWQGFSSSTTDASQLTSGTLAGGRLGYDVVQAFRGDRSVDAPVTSDSVNGNWDRVSQPGSYRVAGNYTNTNMPQGAYTFGTLLVLAAGANLESRTQVYYAHNTGKVYSRTAWNTGDWTAWRRLLDTDDQIPGGSGSSQPTLQQSDGTVQGGPNVTVNYARCRKIGGVVTLNWNVSIGGTKYATGGADAVIVQVPDGFRPPFSVDATCHNGSTIWGYAVDPDGGLRLRTNNIGGGGLSGSIAYATS